MRGLHGIPGYTGGRIAARVFLHPILEISRPEKTLSLVINPIYSENADTPNTNDHYFRRCSWRGVFCAHEKPAG